MAGKKKRKSNRMVRSESQTENTVNRNQNANMNVRADVEHSDQNVRRVDDRSNLNTTLDIVETQPRDQDVQPFDPNAQPYDQNVQPQVHPSTSSDHQTGSALNLVNSRGPIQLGGGNSVIHYHTNYNNCHFYREETTRNRGVTGHPVHGVPHPTHVGLQPVGQQGVADDTSESEDEVEIINIDRNNPKARKQKRKFTDRENICNNKSQRTPQQSIPNQITSQQNPAQRSLTQQTGPRRNTSQQCSANNNTSQQCSANNNTSQQCSSNNNTSQQCSANNNTSQQCSANNNISQQCSANNNTSQQCFSRNRTSLQSKSEHTALKVKDRIYRDATGVTGCRQMGLKPGDIVDFDSPYWSCAVYVGYSRVVWSDWRTDHMVMEGKLNQPFRKINIISEGRCHVFTPSERIARARGLVGKKFTKGDREWRDFQIWICTGLSKDEAYKKGFRVQW